MNSIKAVITHIQTHESISLVKAATGDGIVFTAVMVDTPLTAGFMAAKAFVAVNFKETAVSISKGGNAQSISIQNQVPGTIQAIEPGAILSRINLLCGTTVLTAIITSHACNALQLKKDDAVLALIKSTEIIISPHD